MLEKDIPSYIKKKNKGCFVYYCQKHMIK